jgi:hypothetical protein
MPYLKTINNMYFVFLIPIFFIETKTELLKKSRYVSVFEKNILTV